MLKTPLQEDSLQSDFLGNPGLPFRIVSCRMSPLFTSPSSLTRREEFFFSVGEFPIDRTSEFREIGPQWTSPHLSVPGIFMLFIERGVDEAIVIGDTTVRILEVSGGQVRVGISSPQSPYREAVLECSDSDDGGYDSFRGLQFESESLAFFA